MIAIILSLIFVLLLFGLILWVGTKMFKSEIKQVSRQTPTIILNPGTHVTRCSKEEWDQVRIKYFGDKLPKIDNACCIDNNASS